MIIMTMAIHNIVQFFRWTLTIHVLIILYLLSKSDAQSVTATFRNSVIDEYGVALLTCKFYNLGANFVEIERSILSRPEQLVLGQQLLPSVADNLFLTLTTNDGVYTYAITIREAHHYYDAGTYTCNIFNANQQTIASTPAQLNINYNPETPFNPRCSIVQSSGLERISGSEVRLGCHSDLGYPPVDIAWSYSGCNEGRFLPQPSGTNSGAYYSELKVTLSGEDNGGVFFCTISRPDGSFSSSCSIGSFKVDGGKECIANDVIVTTQSMTFRTSNITTDSKSSRRHFTDGTLFIFCLISSLIKIMGAL